MYCTNCSKILKRYIISPFGNVLCINVCLSCKLLFIEITEQKRVLIFNLD